jgi:hypothetical protein
MFKEKISSDSMESIHTKDVGEKATIKETLKILGQYK